jgi:hypothetical protein
MTISSEHNPGMADAVIAGISKTHDLVIVTRGTKHFSLFGIGVTSPDEGRGFGRRRRGGVDEAGAASRGSSGSGADVRK